MRSISLKLTSIHYRHDPCKLPPNCRVSWGLSWALREKGKGLEAKFMKFKLSFAGFLRSGSRNLTISSTGFSRQIFFTRLLYFCPVHDSMQNGLQPQRRWNMNVHHVAYELTLRVLRPNWHGRSNRCLLHLFNLPYCKNSYWQNMTIMTMSRSPCRDRNHTLPRHQCEFRFMWM